MAIALTITLNYIDNVVVAIIESVYVTHFSPYAISGSQIPKRSFVADQTLC
jgi:hypothetical protein